MSDETTKPSTEHGKIYQHYCEHPGCKKWGGFGFAKGRGESEWFCWEHQRDARWWQTADPSFVASITQR